MPAEQPFRPKSIRKPLIGMAAGLASQVGVFLIVGAAMFEVVAIETQALQATLTGATALILHRFGIPHRWTYVGAAGAYGLLIGSIIPMMLPAYILQTTYPQAPYVYGLAAVTAGLAGAHVIARLLEVRKRRA